MGRDAEASHTTMRFPKKCKPELACGKEDARYVSMGSAHLHGKRLCSTDGRKLVVIAVERDPEDTDGPVTPEALKAARKPARVNAKSGHQAQIIANGALALSDGSTLPRPDVGDFPRYEAVVPAGEHKPGTGTVAFSARYLWECAQALGVDQVEIYVSDVRGGPIYVRPCDPYRKMDGFAVLMPVTVDP